MQQVSTHRSRVSSPGHHALVHEVHAVLDAADAVGDLREVTEAELLLVLEAERAVVGGDDGQLVHPQALPQVAVVVPVIVFGSDGRAAHELGALETGPGQMVLEGHVQVLGARLGEDVEAFVAASARHRALRRPTCARCTAARCRRPWTRSMARLVASPSSRLGRLIEWYFGSVSPRARCCWHEHVDGDAVLGVHHDHGAVLAGRLHGPQDLPVVAVEDARVGHEQLEAGDALVVDEVGHVLQRLIVDAADDLVEARSRRRSCRRPCGATPPGPPARCRRRSEQPCR